MNNIPNAQTQQKATVLLFEPGKYPKTIEIDGKPSGLVKALGGEFDISYPFGNDLCVACRADAYAIGMPVNRAIRAPDVRKEMTYGELCSVFRQQEGKGADQHLLGHILFTEDSFTKPYSEAERTYIVSSNNKAFIPGMGGYSIYGSSLDGSDVCVRLEGYMAAERGGSSGWKIERCHLVEPSKDILEVMYGPFLICDGSNQRINSLSEFDRHMLLDKYHYPESFKEVGGKVELAAYRPQRSREDR